MPLLLLLCKLLQKNLQAAVQLSKRHSSSVDRSTADDPTKFSFLSQRVYRMHYSYTLPLLKQSNYEQHNLAL
jgi:hypothetical protein